MEHYEALGLTSTASAADIRSAYRRLVLLTHPDRTPDPAAHARYLAINVAYEVLSDPVRRAAYDELVSAVAPAPATNAPLYSVRKKHTRSASTTRRTSREGTEAYPYETIYLRYALLGKTVCQILLIFSLLLGIDRIWVRTYPKEVVLSCTMHSSKNGKGGPPYCVIKTQNATFRGPCLNTGEGLTLRRTALFGQVLSLEGTDKVRPEFAPQYWDENFLYAGGGLIFLAALVLTSAAGVWPGPAGRRQLECATMAIILAGIVTWFLVTH